MIELLLFSLAAQANEGFRPPAPPPEIAELVADLGGEDRSDRVFASRDLRMRVSVAVSDSEGRIDRLKTQEAILLLQDYDRTVAPACIQALAMTETRAGCADVLRMLETPSALPVLQDALQSEDRWGVRRRVERAIRAIEASSATQP